MLAEHILEIEILETKDFLETKFLYKTEIYNYTWYDTEQKYIRLHVIHVINQQLYSD